MTEFALETDGTFAGSTLLMDGKPVPNCTGIEIAIMPDVPQARVTAYFDGVPVTFKGTDLRAATEEELD